MQEQKIKPTIRNIPMAEKYTRSMNWSIEESLRLENASDQATDSDLKKTLAQLAEERADMACNDWEKAVALEEEMQPGSQEVLVKRATEVQHLGTAAVQAA